MGTGGGVVGPVMDTADAQLVASVKLAMRLVTHPVPVNSCPTTCGASS